MYRRCALRLLLGFDDMREQPSSTLSLVFIHQPREHASEAVVRCGLVVASTTALHQNVTTHHWHCTTFLVPRGRAVGQLGGDGAPKRRARTAIEGVSGKCSGGNTRPNVEIYHVLSPKHIVRFPVTSEQHAPNT